jgi:hypothetical protein
MVDVQCMYVCLHRGVLWLGISFCIIYILAFLFALYIQVSLFQNIRSCHIHVLVRVIFTRELSMAKECHQLNFHFLINFGTVNELSMESEGKSLVIVQLNCSRKQNKSKAASKLYKRVALEVWPCYIV